MKFDAHLFEYFPNAFLDERKAVLQDASPKYVGVGYLISPVELSSKISRSEFQLIFRIMNSNFPWFITYFNRKMVQVSRCRLPEARTN